MSQELVRSNNSQPSNLMPVDLWGAQQQSSALATTGETQPLQVIHRSLRGRYHWALLLATAGSLLGAAAGWASFDQKFRASGILRIDPQFLSIDSAERTRSLYNEYMNAEATRIRSQAVVDAAVTQPEFKKLLETRKLPEAVGRAVLNSGLSGAFLPRSYNIQVTVTGGDSELVTAAAAAAVQGYLTVRGNNLEESSGRTLRALKDQQNSITTEIQNRQASIDERSKKIGSEDVAAVIDAKRAILNGIDQEHSNADLLLTRMKAALSNAKVTADTPDETIARIDAFYGQLLDQRRQLESQADSLRARLGPAHPLVVNIDREIGNLALKTREYREQLTKAANKAIIFGANASEIITVTPEMLKQQEGTVAELESRKGRFQGELNGMESERFEIVRDQREIANLQGTLERLKNSILQAEVRAATEDAMARAEVLPSGAETAEDKRPTMATFGFVVGGILPIMGVFLWGLADRKYRYSDEATQGSTKGIALLGILPNLPDRLSDPQQATVAAHCVHQIRTMLQLNVIGEDPSILTVTSATSGDGKTSLTLALGLSFAASGSRTLLIDTDIIGAGLSSRLGIREETGITEAILDRNPLQFIRDSDVQNLSVLPVGIRPGQQAGVFTPAAVRRLFAEVRKHFDIIMIDTGPVLGSIEATPLVAAADATILTVAKGQNRDLVEKAITHLRTIGAKIAGVVFNRAGNRDFEKSISGISLRSVSRQQNGQHYGTNGTVNADRVGPVVSSVKGSSN
jgi:polysaccharide biosynthesis transport protein